VKSHKKKKPVEEVDGDDFKYFLLAGQPITTVTFMNMSIFQSNAF
jgi:hypothetical protein